MPTTSGRLPTRTVSRKGIVSTLLESSTSSSHAYNIRKIANKDGVKKRNSIHTARVLHHHITLVFRICIAHILNWRVHVATVQGLHFFILSFFTGLRSIILIESSSSLFERNFKDWGNHFVLEFGQMANKQVVLFFFNLDVPFLVKVANHVLQVNIYVV